MNNLSAPTTREAAPEGASYSLPGLPGLPNYFKEGGLGMDFQFARAMGAQTASGAEVGECWLTAHKIPDGDIEAWYREWYATGSRVHNIAMASLAGGHDMSARQAFLRAFTYYRSSQFYLSAADPRRRDAWGKTRECFKQASQLFAPPFEPLTVTVDNVDLPGYFLKATEGDEPRPTLMVLGGFDSTLEETYLGLGSSALLRGWNALLVEGPGQVTSFMLNGAPFRHDYERPMAAFVDYALSRPDVDPERLAMVALSMGGYLGLRVACFEPRIKAYIINSPLPNLRKVLMVTLGLPPVDDYLENADELVNWKALTVRWFFEEAKHRFKIKTISEWMEVLRPYSIEGFENQIVSPVLGILGLGEGTVKPTPRIASGHIPTIVPAFHKKLKVPNKLHTFTYEDGAEAHCQLNNRTLLAQVMFDWLDNTFELAHNKLWKKG